MCGDHQMRSRRRTRALAKDTAGLVDANIQQSELFENRADRLRPCRLFERWSGYLAEADLVFDGLRLVRADRIKRRSDGCASSQTAYGCGVGRGTRVLSGREAQDSTRREPECATCARRHLMTGSGTDPIDPNNRKSSNEPDGEMVFVRLPDH
jgi:hypothetical protein